MASTDVSHVALLSQAGKLQFADLLKVAAAIDKQVTRDFGPLWKIDATVSAFQYLEDVPAGYWKIIMVEGLNSDAEGYHQFNGQPYALVKASPNIDEWSLTASHECLEMLVDPWGNFQVEGNSPTGDQGRVQFLVEVCDPCESSAYAYTSDGVLVSDFYTPNYFDPVVATSVRYSFRGAIEQPGQVLAGGYLSWYDPAQLQWFQKVFPTGAAASYIQKINIVDPAKGGSFREQIDRQSGTLRSAVLTGGRSSMLQPVMPIAKVAEAAKKNAEALKAEIKRLTTPKAAGK